MFPAVAILISVYLVQTSADLLYSKVSTVRATGELCINNCVNGKCQFDWRGNEAACETNGTPAPVFFTSQKKGTRKYCLSHCGRFGYKYDWCFTSNNRDWDYCSSARRTQDSILTKRRFTKSLGPCKDYCKRNANNVHMCTSFWGEVDECTNKPGTYIQAKTVNGLNCVGTCAKHGGKDYYWCYDTNRMAEYCALPARPRLVW